MAPDPTRTVAAPSSTPPVALRRWMRTVDGFHLLMGAFETLRARTGDRSAPDDDEPQEVDHAGR